MKTVLVTGGSGFIGTNLVLELLKQDYKVVNLSKHPTEVEVETLNLDLTKDDLTDLDNYEFDYVVHLAAVSSIKLAEGNENETLEINLDGTKKLLEYFDKKSLKKFIFMSSVTVYDCHESGQTARGSEAIPSPSSKNKDTRRVYRLAEENALIDSSCNAYSYSKLLAEQECEKHSLPLLILRLANAYGPHQRIGKVPNLIPQVVSQGMKGEIEIHNGKFARDFIYVTDVVDAIIAGMESDAQGTLNLGTGKPTSVRDIAEVVANEFNVEIKDLKLKINAPLELVPNISLIKDKLGWEPKVSLSEGLKKTINYYRAAGDQPKNYKSVSP